MANWKKDNPNYSLLYELYTGEKRELPKDGADSQAAIYLSKKAISGTSRRGNSKKAKQILWTVLIAMSLKKLMRIFSGSK